MEEMHSPAKFPDGKKIDKWIGNHYKKTEKKYKPVSRKNESCFKIKNN
jgi:hypothetical protein